MYNAGKVILGIIIFAAIFTSPFWINFSGSGDELGKPDLVYPAGEDECIMPTDYMTTNHMDLLNEWRDLVVREDKRYFKKDGKIVYVKGEPAELSLTHTCMKCHDDKEAFCDKCHNYLEVNPYCWDCHVAPGADNSITFKKEGE